MRGSIFDLLLGLAREHLRPCALEGTFSGIVPVSKLASKPTFLLLCFTSRRGLSLARSKLVLQLGDKVTFLKRPLRRVFSVAQEILLSSYIKLAIMTVVH